MMGWEQGDDGVGAGRRWGGSREMMGWEPGDRVVGEK